MLDLSSRQFDFFSDNVFALYGSIGPDGTLLSIKGDLLDKLEIDTDLMVGQNFEELVVWQTHDENVQNLKTAFADAQNGAISKTMLQFREGANQSEYVDLNLIPNFQPEADTIFFCATDATAVQSELNHFRDRCDYFLFAAEKSEVGLWFWNLGNNESYSTPKFNELLSVKPNHVLSNGMILDSVYEDDREAVDELLQETKNGRTERTIQFRISKSADDFIWVELECRAFFNEKLQSVTLVGSLRDISDTRAANEALERIYNRERKAKLEANEANRTKDLFLALVSHELRGPLNSILGWTRILLTEEVDEKTRRKALETIERNSKAQATLIEDLVDSARVTSGKLKLEFHNINLFDLIEEIVDSHQPEMHDRHIEHKFDFDSKEIFVVGDTMRLKQVFGNIIGNAIKFTPDNGEIVTALHTRDTMVEISISDNGQGISKERLETIFRRFEQADENRPIGKSGLGLGLSLAKILVEKHKGRIKAESDGQALGSKFTVSIPLHDHFDEVSLDASSEPEIAGEPMDITESRLWEKRILIVEDDDDARNVLELFLKQEGALFESTRSVAEAFAYLEGSKELPELVISDIGMPDEDGYSLIKRLRKTVRFKSIPAIALSGFTADKNKNKALKLGFQKYHLKPFEPERLFREISELIK